MWWFFIIIGIIVIIGVVGIKESNDRGKVIKATEENQENYIREKGISKSADFEWHDIMNQYRYRFIADDRAQKVYLSAGIGVGVLDEIPYEQIIGFEVVEDSQVVGGIKRAIVGGVLTGAAGAIVGSQTAHKTAVSSMKAVIYREDISHPQYVLEFIKTKTKTTDPNYVSAKKFTDNINATLKAVMAKAEHTIRPSQQAQPKPVQETRSGDVTEKLKTLKAAYDQNLITEAEYEEKKKELLRNL